MALSREEREAAEKQARVDAMPAYTALAQSLDPVQRDVLLKHNIITDANGTPGIVSRRQPDGSEVYIPRVSVEAVRRLLALDITPDHAWTDWIFHQAGGGNDAMAASKAMLDKTMHEKATLLRKQGLTPDQIKARQAVEEPRYRAYMTCADEDLLEKYKTIFGWTSDFPGYKVPGGGSGRYEEVEKAMKAFNPILRRIKRVNRVLADAGQPPISDDPRSYARIGDVFSTVLRAERAEAVAYLRADVRHAKWKAATPDAPGFAGMEPWKQKNTVYADDNLSLVVPLSHAAAVEYGSDTWGFSSKAAFAQRLASAEPANRTDPWSLAIYGRSTVPVAVIGILLFKVPLPQIASRDAAGAPIMDAPDSAALIVDATHEAETDDVTVMFGSQRQLALKQFIAMIRAEPTRKTDVEGIRLDGVDAAAIALEEIEKLWRETQTENQIAAGDGSDTFFALWAQQQDEVLATRVADTVTILLQDYLSGADAHDTERVQAQAEYRVYNNAAKALAARANDAAPGSVEAVSVDLARTAVSGLLRRATNAVRLAQLVPRGANAYETPEEAQAVVDSITAAVEALVAWTNENRGKLAELYTIQPPKSASRKRGKRVKAADDVEDQAAQGGGNA